MLAGERVDIPAMTKKQTIDDVARAIDLEAKTVWARSGSFSNRPSHRPKQPSEVTRAKARLRANRWRVENDAAKRPETVDIAMALLKGLVHHHDDKSIGAALSVAEYNIVKYMVANLTGRGYCIDQIKIVCRRLRKRLLATQADPKS